MDNICTNDLITDRLSGLVIDDVSDHLPVFNIIKININKSQGEKKCFKMTNIPNFENFKTELNNHDWNIIYKKNDVNLTYDCFIETIKNIYDRNLHVKKFICVKRKTISHELLKAFRMHVKRKVIYTGDLSDVG